MCDGGFPLHAGGNAKIKMGLGHFFSLHLFFDCNCIFGISSQHAMCNMQQDQNAMSNTGNVSLAWNASIEDDAIMVYDCETKNAMQLTGYKSRIETLLPASYNLTTDTGFTIEAFVWKYVCPPNRDALASSLAPSSENKINLCSLTQPCPIQQCLSSTVTQHTVQT